MATAVWSPPPGILFSEQETAKGLSYRITCSIEADPAAVEPAPTITGYSVALNPTPEVDVLNIDVEAAGVTVSSESLAGLFGIDFIDYWVNGQVVRVFAWDDLPETAEEIVEFRPSHDKQRSYTLKVTALLSDGGSETAAYDCIVLQNWTAGRDRLKEEVDARRHP
jgi:hypothetical protein